MVSFRFFCFLSFLSANSSCVDSAYFAFMVVPHVVLMVFPWRILIVSLWILIYHWQGLCFLWGICMPRMCTGSYGVVLCLGLNCPEPVFMFHSRVVVPAPSRWYKFTYAYGIVWGCDSFQVIFFWYKTLVDWKFPCCTLGQVHRNLLSVLQLFNTLGHKSGGWVPAPFFFLLWWDLPWALKSQLLGNLKFLWSSKAKASAHCFESSFNFWNLRISIL